MSKQIHNYTAATTIDASADLLLIDPASSGVYKSINRNTLLALASQPLGLTDSQSPQNKTLDNTNSITVKDGSLTIQNSAGTTKQAVFSASGITAGQTRTFTFPDASGTLTTNAGTQTLTNKTLTSPVITGGTIDNSTITVDSIAGHTLATIVTVANLQISNGVLNSANAVTATSVADGAIQPKALVSGTGSGWAWQTWSPNYTNLTIGNGTVTAKYIQVGKTVMFVWKFVLGTTSAVGTIPTVSFPVTTNSSYSTNDFIAEGFANLGGTNYYLAAEWASTTVFNPGVWQSVPTYLNTFTSLTAAIPTTWGSTNAMSLRGFYEAA